MASQLPLILMATGSTQSVPTTPALPKAHRLSSLQTLPSLTLRRLSFDTEHDATSTSILGAADLTPVLGIARGSHSSNASNQSSIAEEVEVTMVTKKERRPSMLESAYRNLAAMREPLAGAVVVGL